MLGQTRALPAALGEADLAEAVHGLHARRAIEDLVAIYAMSVDDHDIETVLDCFCPDACFVRRGVAVVGIEELRPFYQQMMARYGLTVHSPHSHVVSLDSAVHGLGVATGHAELGFGDTLMVAAFRYHDEYNCHDGHWRFARRELSFAYVAPAASLPAVYMRKLRVSWPDEQPTAGDYPETLTTWTTYSAQT